jgi:predicted RNase H-like nuclease
MMRFLGIGIDFGWQGKPSGLAALDWDGHSLSLIEMQNIKPFEEILASVERIASNGQALVAIDAPIIITNDDGMRDADRQMHKLFGKYHAGAYPANLGRPFAKNTIRLVKELQRMGFEHACEIVHREPGRYQIEVYPHAAIVELFDLQRIIKYKKGLIRDRFGELSRYRSMLLERLPSLDPALPLSSLPDFEQTGHEMKEAEDQMDALTCAYVGAYWWYWGLERNHAYGSTEGGYIVVPRRDFVPTTND